MADVFVSYKREDQERVAALVRSLRAAHLAVWWDADIAANAPWEATIENELARARVVIVAWSHASVQSENVKAEARRARSDGKLVQVFLEECEPPLFFGERQGIDLTDWTPEHQSHAFETLTAATRAILANKPPPPGVGFAPARLLESPRALISALLLLATVTILRWHFERLLGWRIGMTEAAAWLGVTLTCAAVLSLAAANAKRFVRRLLSTDAALWTSAIAAVGITLFMSFSSVALVWTGPSSLTVVRDGQPAVLHAKRVGGRQRAHLWGYSFQKIDLRVGSYVRAISLAPTGQSVELPPYATAHLDANFARVENALLQAFFSFYELRQLERADSAIDAYSKQPDADSGAIDRLRRLSAALNTIYAATPDWPQAADRIDEIAQISASDDWLPALRAASALRQRQYDVCLATLDTPLLNRMEQVAAHEIVAATHFLRGVCLLRASASDQDKSRAQLTAQQAYVQFSRTESMLAREIDASIVAVAYPSSVYFQGTARYYAGDVRGALAAYARTAELARGALRVRALNGQAHARVVVGDLDGAEALLQEALKLDPQFPAARSTYAFVLIERNDLDHARHYFELNARDPTLRRLSPMDAFLAESILVQIDDQLDPTHALAISGYERLLSELGTNANVGISPPSLRLAFQARDVANNVYFSGRLFGVELFGTNLLCRAYALVRDPALANDARAVTLRQELEETIPRVAPIFESKYYSGLQKGWFRYFNDCPLGHVRDALPPR